MKHLKHIAVGFCLIASILCFAIALFILVIQYPATIELIGKIIGITFLFVGFIYICWELGEKLLFELKK